MPCALRGRGGELGVCGRTEIGGGRGACLGRLLHHLLDAGRVEAILRQLVCSALPAQIETRHFRADVPRLSSSIRQDKKIGTYDYLVSP